MLIKQRIGKRIIIIVIIIIMIIMIITLFKSLIVLAEHEWSANWGDFKPNKSNQINHIKLKQNIISKQKIINQTAQTKQNL